MPAMNPIRSVWGTAGAGTGATAVAFPNILPNEEHLRDFIIVNRGTVEIQMKKSALASGPDASNNTDGLGFIIPAGQTHTYNRSPTELYFYVYAASNCLYAVVVGNGE